MINVLSSVYLFLAPKKHIYGRSVQAASTALSEWVHRLRVHGKSMELNLSPLYKELRKRRGITDPRYHSAHGQYYTLLDYYLASEKCAASRPPSHNFEYLGLTG